MVLVVGRSLPTSSHPPPELRSLESFLSSSSGIRADVDTFKALETRTVGEEEGLLYVHQHEFAVSHPGDARVKCLGSSDATTCHVAVLRHPLTGVTAVAHLDAAQGIGTNVRLITERVFELSSRLSRVPAGDDAKTLEISLVGGFQDEPGKSEELSLALLNELVKSPVNYVLGLCCIGSLNTVMRRKDLRYAASIPFPVFYGCAVDVTTGQIFPANFASKGPEEILRHVRCSFSREGSSELYQVYDSESGCFEIAPFRFSNYPWLKMWCNASPTDILLCMSTSPEVEPDDFVPTLKAAMRTVVDNPRPDRTIFRGGKPIKYTRGVSGRWSKVEDGEDSGLCDDGDTTSQETIAIQ